MLISHMPFKGLGLFGGLSLNILDFISIIIFRCAEGWLFSLFVFLNRSILISLM